MNAKRGTRVVAAWLLVWVVAPASAQRLTGADWELGRLYDVNPATGAATNPRPTGIPNLTGIAFSPGGVLYGIANRDTPVNPNSLFRIDPVTGASTLIGPTGLPAVIEGDLAFNPVTGVLYGLWGARGELQEFFTIDTTTGAATVVGNLGPAPAPANFADYSALEFLPDGRMVVLDSTYARLLTVNPATAAAVSEMPLSARIGATAGLALNPATGVLYAADGERDGTNNLYRLNPATGQLTLVGPTGLPAGLASLEFVPEPAAPALLAAIALLTLRRRRGAQSLRGAATAKLVARRWDRAPDQNPN